MEEVMCRAHKKSPLTYQETLEHGIIDMNGGDDSCEGKFRIIGQRGRGINFE